MEDNALRPRITVGITGSSGAVYALRLLALLPSFYQMVDVVMSNAARLVLRQEMDMDAPQPGPWAVPGTAPDATGTVRLWHNQDYSAPFASGSNCARQMVIVPCSMSTVACLAHGTDQNLLHHAAGVALKEKKQLIVVPRETPLSAIHLRNLTTLAELGITVIPAMPGFYGGQNSFDDLINFVLQKITGHLGLDIQLSRKWGDQENSI